MSTTLEAFDGGVSDDTCPHGVEGDNLLSCWYCYAEEQSGRMAIDDPRRDD